MCGKVWRGFVGVSVCCVWDSLLLVCGSECVLFVGQFGVGFWECVCAMCGKIWCGFVGVSCAVSGSVWCWFVGVSVCCVWEILERVSVGECVLCVGLFGACKWE